MDNNIALKDATVIKHKQAERMPFNMRMINSQLSVNEYLLYLIQQLHIFRTIEKIGLPFSKLARTANIESDIAELNTKGFHNNKILSATSSYVEYLNSLNYQQVLPHIYLNYLALMFGGQMMKKAVPSGGKMYDFEDMKTAMQSIRTLQQNDWADEVNKGYDFIISIFSELELACSSQTM